MPNVTSPATITVAETARRIGCSRWRLYHLIQQEKFPPAVHMGGAVAINVELLNEYLRTGGQR
jgi:excisionase family DNA binding protein